MIGRLPPIAVAVYNCKHVDLFMNGYDILNIWSADVKIGRYGFGCKTFEGVLIAEASIDSRKPDVVFVLGFHNADHDPTYLADLHAVSGLSLFRNKEIVRNQKKFILYIEDEEKQHKESTGELGRLFNGHEYPIQVRVLDQYTMTRGIIDADFLMSYFADNGEFQLHECNALDVIGVERVAYTDEECRARYYNFDEWANGDISTV
jgi:hypothetical protein